MLKNAISKYLPSIKAATRNNLLKKSTPSYLEARFFSTIKGKKETEIVREQAQEEIEEITNMGKELKESEIQKMIQDRQDQLLEISKEKTAPNSALIAALIVTSPLLLGSIGLNLLSYQGLMASELPYYLINFVKYAGLQLGFMSGIHWGFAISEHDLQTDAVNSSPFARNYFLLSSVPLALAFLCSGNFAYFFASSTLNFKIANIVGLIATHLGVFLGDCYMFKLRRVPFWYLRLKLFLSIVAVMSLSGICMLIYNDEEKLKLKSDPNRRYIPSDDKLLGGR